MEDFISSSLKVILSSRSVCMLGGAGSYKLKIFFLKELLGKI